MRQAYAESLGPVAFQSWTRDEALPARDTLWRKECRHLLFPQSTRNKASESGNAPSATRFLELCWHPDLTLLMIGSESANPRHSLA